MGREDLRFLESFAIRIRSAFVYDLLLCFWLALVRFCPSVKIGCVAPQCFVGRDIDSFGSIKRNESIPDGYSIVVRGMKTHA